MPRLQVTGLVSIANAIRRELSAPLTAHRRDELRQRVEHNLRQIERIFLMKGAGARDLPTPSRRALQFLSTVKWDGVAISQGAAAPAKQPAVSVSWVGVTAFIDRHADRLAADISDVEAEAIRESVSRMSRRMELSFARKGHPPESLTPNTRAQRGWLAYFSQPENIATYVCSRKLASRIYDSAAAHSRHFPPPLTIHFRDVKGFYKARFTSGRTILWLPTPMISFDEAGFVALASMMYGRSSDAKPRVFERMTAEAYQSLRIELEALGGIAEQSRGATHDLRASFERVNAAYFGGKMARPRLIWNNTLTGRKFGHFDFLRDTLMVTQTLDSPAAPEFVVDFLVFHELLHKFHGQTWVNGRGYAHTTEFYRDERKFARYEEAEQILNRLARSMR